MCTLVEGYVAMARADRRSAARKFAAAVRQLTGQYDARDVLDALVGLAVSTDDPGSAPRRWLARLDRTRTVQEVSLMPREPDYSEI